MISSMSSKRLEKCLDRRRKLNGSASQTNRYTICGETSVRRTCTNERQRGTHRAPSCRKRCASSSLKLTQNWRQHRKASCRESGSQRETKFRLTPLQTKKDEIRRLLIRNTKIDSPENFGSNLRRSIMLHALFLKRRRGVSFPETET